MSDPVLELVAQIVALLAEQGKTAQVAPMHVAGEPPCAALLLPGYVIRDGKLSKVIR